MDGTTESVADLLRANLQKEKELPKIDFLMIDHDKDMYLFDLKVLETSGMVQQGTQVVADNVVFARIDNYIHYMQQLAEQGTVETRTVLSHVEYSQEDDRIGEHDNGDGFVDGVETVGKNEALTRLMCPGTGFYIELKYVPSLEQGGNKGYTYRETVGTYLVCAQSRHVTVSATVRSHGRRDFYTLYNIA
eukprot:scaffold80264_cov50-Attheya_sp.AAC.1